MSRVAPAAPQAEIHQAARAGILLVAAGGLTGVLNLAFNVVVAREGGVHSYGAIGPLLTLVTVVGLLVTGFQYGIARQAAVSAQPVPRLLRSAFRVVLPLGLLPAGVAAFAVPLAAFLGLATPVPVLVLAGLVAVGVAATAVNGLLIGLSRFRVIAAITVGGAALRLGFGFFVGHGETAVTASVAASIVPLVVSFGVGLAVLMLSTAPSRPAGPGVQSVSAGATGVAASLVAGALWSVWGLPVLFARHALPGTTAGDFAASQLLTGALIWGTAPLVTAFFPAIARGAGPRAVSVGEGATLLVALLGAGALVVGGPQVMGDMYGSAFHTSSLLLLELSASAVATAGATFLCWAAVAQRGHVRRALGALAVALALELLWDGLLARSSTTLALGPLLVLAASGGLLSVAGLTGRSRSPRPAESGSGSAAPSLRHEPVPGDQ